MKIANLRNLAAAAILGIVGFGTVALAQSTTTLTFDEFSNGTILTTQYQSLGVAASGATIFTSCSTCLFPSVSGSNVAYASSGQMSFTFDPTVIGGTVQSVSAYVTDYSGPAGIYAYDASNNLLGQALLPTTGGVNQLLTVTTTGNPIAYVLIHDGGGQFSIDNLAFAWIPTVVSCSQTSSDLATTVAGLSTSDFIDTKHAAQLQALMENKVKLFDLLMSKGAADQALMTVEDFLQDATNELVSGADQTNLENLINQLITATQAGQC